VVHDVAEALKATLPTERVYLMSLGSHQGNAHVHWHVVPAQGVARRGAEKIGARLISRAPRFPALVPRVRVPVRT